MIARSLREINGERHRAFLNQSDQRSTPKAPASCLVINRVFLVIPGWPWSALGFDQSLSLTCLSSSNKTITLPGGRPCTSLEDESPCRQTAFGSLTSYLSLMHSTLLLSYAWRRVSATGKQGPVIATMEVPDAQAKVPVSDPRASGLNGCFRVGLQLSPDKSKVHAPATCLSTVSRQIERRPAKIEDSAVGRGHDRIGLGQLGIRVVYQFNPPRPIPLAGQVLDDLLQPPAVGNRPVQQPEGLADAEAGQRFPDDSRAGCVSLTLR